MPFVVKGYYNGTSYAVQVGVQSSRANDGVVAGDPRIMGMLQGHEGLPMRPAVGMTALVGTNDDPAWVLAALYAETEVTDIDGTDIPDLRGRRRQPGAVY